MKKFAYISVLIGFLSVHAAAAVIPSAYYKIADYHHIPVDVFYAVMLQESGKATDSSYLPWPWVLNVELKAYYFDSRASAEIALRQFLALNANTRIAVGLGQIYLPSHGHLFPDKTELLDPGTNLLYAAKLITDEFQWTLKQGKPNWWVAVGRYHTPSNENLAKNYRENVFHRCEKISEFCTRYGAI